MILHWLAGYSVPQLMMLVGSFGIFLGGGVILLGSLNGNNPALTRSGWLAMLGGACTTAAHLLRNKLHWEVAMIILAGLGFAMTICFFFQYAKARRITIPQPQPPLPSDEIWPPPPNSPGGQS